MSADDPLESYGLVGNDGVGMIIGIECGHSAIQSNSVAKLVVLVQSHDERSGLVPRSKYERGDFYGMVEAVILL